MKHQILEPIFTRRDKRGEFQEILRDYTWRTVIIGNMHTGSELGHHYHIHTTLFFYLISGSALIRIIDVGTNEKSSIDIVVGQGVILAPNQAHVIHFRQESSFLLLKSISYNPEDPDTYSYPVQEH